MKFLLDVNASGPLLPILLELEHDVVCVGDVNARLTDSEILAWAVREERIIVTTDSDFEQMIWLQERPHHGVLRLENLPRRERVELLKEVLVNHGEALATGAIVIATQKKIRIRKKRIGD